MKMDYLGHTIFKYSTCLCATFRLSFLVAVSDNSRQLELSTPGRLFKF